MLSTQLIVVCYINVWLHVAINYKVIPRPLGDIKAELKLQVLFYVRMLRSAY